MGLLQVDAQETLIIKSKAESKINSIKIDRPEETHLMSTCGDSS